MEFLESMQTEEGSISYDKKKLVFNLGQNGPLIHVFKTPFKGQTQSQLKGVGGPKNARAYSA